MKNNINLRNIGIAVLIVLAPLAACALAMIGLMTLLMVGLLTPIWVSLVIFAALFIRKKDRTT
ncbi:MAG TPA: hypothetical protein VD907_06150 [Verrucomicrobiae bacterium]|nr:hypothetical protein [Verrucomicrobiae bacterium]